MSHTSEQLAFGFMHTPGPWKWSIRIAEWTKLEGPNEEIITWADITKPSELSDEITAANARLITAAPDLLKQLQRVMAYWNQYENVTLEETFTGVEAAIAKATGKEVTS